MKKLMIAAAAVACAASVYATSGCEGCDENLSVTSPSAHETITIEDANLAVVYKLKFTAKTLVQKSAATGGCPGWYFEQGSRTLEGLLWQCLYACEDTEVLSGQVNFTSGGTPAYVNGDVIQPFQYILWEKKGNRLFTDGLSHYNVSTNNGVVVPAHFTDSPAAISMLRFSKKANKTQVLWNLDTAADVALAPAQITVSGGALLFGTSGRRVTGTTWQPFLGGTYVEAATPNGWHLDVFQVQAVGFGSTLTDKATGLVIPNSVSGGFAGRIVPVALNEECRGQLIDFCADFDTWCTDGGYANYWDSWAQTPGTGLFDGTGGDEFVGAYGSWSMKYLKKMKGFLKVVPNFAYGNLME